MDLQGTNAPSSALLLRPVYGKWVRSPFANQLLSANAAQSTLPSTRAKPDGRAWNRQNSESAHVDGGPGIVVP
jgi:hypothetical protein